MTKVDKIKKQIVSDLKKINPQKVILFGSLTTGKFMEGKSDVDLLVIKDSDKTLVDRYSEARLSLSLDYPFDIFVLTNDELQKRLTRSFFFREILKNGEVIYEKN